MEKKIYTHRVWDATTQNTGVEAIDKHHVKFVEIINQLVDILNGAESEDNTLDVIHKLLYYAESYFIEEELYFRSIKYANLSSHQKSHRGFLDSVLNFQQNYKNNPEPVRIEMMKFLDRWYKEHILGDDLKAVPH